MPQEHPLPAWLFQALRPIELYTLIILAKSHDYAYNIARSIPQDLDHSTRATPQGIRRALQRMAKDGWITPCPHVIPTGRNEYPYDITSLGQAQLTRELNRLELILQQGRDYLALHRRRSF